MEYAQRGWERVQKSRKSAQFRLSLFRGGLGQEAVADAVDGEEVTRLVGVGLEFLPQLHHVRIHRPGVGEEFIAPDGVENHVAREGAVGILQEIAEQVVLGRRELEFRSEEHTSELQS